MYNSCMCVLYIMFIYTGVLLCGLTTDNSDNVDPED